MMKKKKKKNLIKDIDGVHNKQRKVERGGRKDLSLSRFPFALLLFVIAMSIAGMCVCVCVCDH